MMQSLHQMQFLLLQDKGYQCPFFEGSKHRFKDVQDQPDAQLRESMRLSSMQQTGVA